MASVADQTFSIFSRRQESDDLTRYSTPPQTGFVSTSVDMTSIPAVDGFGTYTQPFAPSPLYTDAASGYLINDGASPSIYADDGDMRLTTSSLSTSIPSAPSSAIGSPASNPGQLGHLSDWTTQTLAGPQPGIVGNDYLMSPDYPNFSGPGMDELSAFDFVTPPTKSYVDPTLMHPDIGRAPLPIPSYDGQFAPHSHHYSPSPSVSSPQSNLLRTNSSSPYLHGAYQPNYSTSPYPIDRHVSMGTNFISPTSTESDDTREKQRCTYPDCGKVFKDLKAHMLTHQNERPEKCPIQTCEYHTKGFARKYDKNRHTLTHYKGTMVCGFCPGSGSAAEKSFNRADVFKRHLTAVHGVEQTPPNSRKKTSAIASGRKLAGYAPDATGKCSTCSQTFANAQEFYEHLDDCVLRIVQQEDPAEAINAQRLAEVENDKSVHQTLEKNNLPITTQTQTSVADDVEEDYDMVEDDEADDALSRMNQSPNSKKKANPVNGVQKSRGMTHSRGGVPLAVKTKGRRSRRDYPSSWGFAKGQMTMKKRIMAVFDGPRRLAKDDMMLNTDHEVRVKLSDGKSYVTDLDVQTLKRAEGFLNATDEEKGPWISDDPNDEQLAEMQELLAGSTASV